MPCRLEVEQYIATLRDPTSRETNSRGEPLFDPSPTSRHPRGARTNSSQAPFGYRPEPAQSATASVNPEHGAVAL